MMTGDLAVRRASSSFLLIQAFGAQLLWHLDGPLLLVTLQPGFANKVAVYRGSNQTLPATRCTRVTVNCDLKSANVALKVRGLCGTLTWNQHDDFTTPEGDVENSVASFAGKFTRAHCALPQGTPPDPCTTYTQRRQYAETACSVIHGPVFQVRQMKWVNSPKFIIISVISLPASPSL